MVKVWGRVSLSILLSAGALAGCGSDDEKGSSKRLDQLTSDEVKALCDSTSATLGGYGMSKDCGGGMTLEAPANQAECVVDYTYTNCAVTVAQAEKCVSDQSCSNFFPSSCFGLASCE
jgi:hypothetical protein